MPKSFIILAPGASLTLTNLQNLKFENYDSFLLKKYQHEFSFSFRQNKLERLSISIHFERA